MRNLILSLLVVAALVLTGPKPVPPAQAATMTVTLAEFQSLAFYFGGPVVYTTAGTDVQTALFGALSGGGGLVFQFSPRPSEASFLVVFPRAVKVENILP